MASCERLGYCSTISSSLRPPARLSRTMLTGIRVPLMQACPSMTWGSEVMSSRHEIDAIRPTYRK